MSMKLIFLPDGGYFFDSSVKTYWSSDLDPYVAALLKGNIPGASGIRKLHHIELAGEQGFISYRDGRGDPQLWLNLERQYPELAKWIEGDPRHHGDRLRVSLGPQGQFFAASNRGYRWHSPSPQFHAELQKMLAGDDDDGAGASGGWRAGWRPSGAAFGVDGSFLIFCEGGAHIALSENFARCYPALNTKIRERFKAPRTTAGVVQYDYIAINPYKANQCLAVWADHTVSWDLPPSFVSMMGAALEWFGATSDDATKARLREAITAGEPPSGANTPRSSFSSSSTLPHAARAQSVPEAPRQLFRPFQPHQTGRVPQALANLNGPVRPSLTYGYSSPAHSAYSSPPPAYSSPPLSTPLYYPSTTPNAWLNTQQSSTGQLLNTVDFWSDFWTQYAQNSALNAAHTAALAGNISGNGGGANYGSVSMFNANPLYTPMAYGGDPAALYAGDPTGGLLAGGGGALAVDPTGVLAGMGLDPVSLMSGSMGMAGGMQAGCSVM